VQPIHDEKGSVTQFIGVQEDITARKRAEWRLTAQHNATRVLAESVSLDQAIPQLLQVIAEALGLDKGEFWQVDARAATMRMTHDWSADPAKSTDFAAGSSTVSIARGESLAGRVWEFGRPRWIEDVADDDSLCSELAKHAGFRSAAGVPIMSDTHVLGVMVFLNRAAREMDHSLRDLLLTLGHQIGMFIERRRAEEIAHERQQFIERLTDANPSLICLFDLPTRRTKFINNRIPSLFGFTPDQINGHDSGTLLGKLVHPADATRLELDQPETRFENVKDGQVVDAEFRARHADGSWRWVRSREVVVHRDQAGKPMQILGNVEDITERKQSEEKFRVMFE
jgi:PAS domain S-box-containing protein